jgi:hypothetical protein
MVIRPPITFIIHCNNVQWIYSLKTTVAEYFLLSFLVECERILGFMMENRTDTQLPCVDPINGVVIHQHTCQRM